MDRWQPIALDELAHLVQRQLAECEPAQREAFRQLQIPPRAMPIVRGGKVESVFAVAERGNEVLYYEDVEEGFNISSLDTSGAVAKPGYEQWDLKHALHHWLGA